MEAIWNSLVDAVSIWLPRVLAALGILLIGWIIALIARVLTRVLLNVQETPESRPPAPHPPE
jgi:hypothetical protein